MNLGLALWFPEDMVDSIEPISKMLKMIEERTNANLNEVLGFIHYHLSIMEADRLGKSPYDCSPELVKDIVQKMRGENL